MSKQLNLGVESIFGAKAGTGLVVLHLGDAHAQLDPDVADEIAAWLTQAAAAARQDEAIWRICEQLQIAPPFAAKVIRYVRERRPQPAAVERTIGG